MSFFHFLYFFLYLQHVLGDFWSCHPVARSVYILCCLFLSVTVRFAVALKALRWPRNLYVRKEFVFGKLCQLVVQRVL